MDRDILIFGSNNPEEAYSRNQELLRALPKNSVAGSLTCPSVLCRGQSLVWRMLLSFLTVPIRFFVLIVRYPFSPQHKVIFVPFPAHIDGILAIILGRFFRKKVVLDFLYGLYDTVVLDRKLIKEGSLLARGVFYFEKFLVLYADVCLMDTKAHKSHMSHLFQVEPDNFGVIYVGINEAAWGSIENNTDGKFTVLLWSTFIPLHGVDVVIEAARKIRHMPIQFEIIGDGQTARAIEAMLQDNDTNIKWTREFKSLHYIRGRVSKANACLGVFASNPKTARVMPYKAYQALCAGKPLLTANTEAAQEVLEDGISALLCEPGDSESLAENVKRLYFDERLQKYLGENGRKTFVECLSFKSISKQLESQLEALID